MSRRTNGEGTIYKRRDGRYEGALYLLTTSSKRKRVRVYCRTREEALAKLAEAKVQAQQGIPVPDKTWKLGEYLEYWLQNIVRPNRRPKTYELYELTVRNYLKPGLGAKRLTQLSVPMVQSYLNQQMNEGCSIRRTQAIRTVLSAALTRAHREELVSRNVARLVELPTWHRGDIHPWSAEEAQQFLSNTHNHPLQPAFMLLLLYGLRRGELLGLRWQDIDFATAQLRIRQQLQRVRGELLRGQVKTNAGKRDLPLVSLAHEVLLRQQHHQQAARHTAGSAWIGTPDSLVFTTATGRPIEPNNFSRSFKRACKQYEVRPIKLHHLRHTQATLLEALDVPPRQAQLILGHAHVSTTQQLYTHPSLATQREALKRVESLFRRTTNRGRCRQKQPAEPHLVAQITSVLSGGPSGTRTQDTLLKSSINEYLEDRLTSVKAVLQDRAKQWLLGVVAVNFSRQDATSSGPSSAGSIPSRKGGLT